MKTEESLSEKITRELFTLMYIEMDFDILIGIYGDQDWIYEQAIDSFLYFFLTKH